MTLFKKKSLFSSLAGLSVFFILQNNIHATQAVVYVDASWMGAAEGADPDGSGPAHSFGEDAFSRVEDAVEAVAPEGWVFISGGIYIEQIEISKDITLQGLGEETVVRSPAILPKFFSTGLKNHPVIWVHDADHVVLKNFVVDGADQGNLNARFMGIGFENAGGSISQVEVENFGSTPLDGSQHGIGIYAANQDGASRTLQVKECNLHDYQKNGMAFRGPGLVVEITDNKVQGMGPTEIIAQNGIQLGLGAAGVVRSNQVSGHVCTHPKAGCTEDPSTSSTADGAAGILLYETAEDVEVSENILVKNQFGIWSVGSSQIEIHDNTLTGDQKKGGSASVYYDTGIAVWDSDQWSDDLGFSERATTGAITRNTVIGFDYGLLARDYTPEGALSSIQAHFNRIVLSSLQGGMSDYAMNAQDNWWGCNHPLEGPCNTVGGKMEATPWLELRMSASSHTIIPGDSLNITADLTTNSQGIDTSSQDQLPGNIEIKFASDLDDVGILSSLTSLSVGKATTTFSANQGPGTVQVSATADQQTVSMTLVVSNSSSEKTPASEPPPILPGAPNLEDPIDAVQGGSGCQLRAEGMTQAPSMIPFIFPFIFALRRTKPPSLNLVKNQH